MMRKYPLLFLILTLVVVQLSCNYPLANPPQPTLVPLQVLPDLNQHLRQEDWLTQISILSGALPAPFKAGEAILSTRYDYAMFTGQPNARAFDYVLEQVQQAVPTGQIEVQEYPYKDGEHSYTWKNLIVTLPGKSKSEEVILLTAHLDDTVVREGDAMQVAPGADDNASGAAALLLALRLLPRYAFQHTIRLVWFSGEEHNLAGSQAYVRSHSMQGVLGVINLDMFAYDSNNDHCVELHIGTLPQSLPLGEALQQTAIDFSLNLHFDALVNQATDRSDHASFWQAGVGAVAITENMNDQNLAGGCVGADLNPWYHRPGDTLDKLNLQTGFEVVRLGLLTVAKLAQP